jgi:CHAT domain-containing protein/Tfp pilus assembly protein PilF
MARKYDDHSLIRRYLLNQLTGEEQEEIERQLLTDEELFEDVQATEDELVDQYLAGQLNVDEAKVFERHFLATQEREQKLRFAKALRIYVATHTTRQRTAEKVKYPWSLLNLVSGSPLQAVALAALMLVAVVGAWRIFFYQSDVERSLIALNSAYHERRPLEARITQLSYAPFVTTRGGATDDVNESELRLAELTLLDVLEKKPTPSAHHALGKVYLAKKDFDRAIGQFEEALSGDQNNARLYADLGAAWLEKGKDSLDKGRANPRSAESGKGMEELGRSLENVHKAIELDSTLLEALFNRALAEQYLTLYQQAENDWREYLKRDGSSPWAAEARQYLKLLEERKARTSGASKQLQDDFLKAFEARNDDAAWAALSLSRTRTGNAIVETLLDELLSLHSSGRRPEANDKQEMLRYAGALELQRAGDRFTLDLARLYGATTPSQRATLTPARALMKVGIESYNKAEYAQAIDTFSRARELFAQSSDEGEMLFAEAWVGYSLLRIPDPEHSGETFRRLSRIFEARSYRSLFAQSLLAEADSLNVQNEFSKVLEQANRARAVSEQIHDRANVIRCLQASTSMQLILSNYQESLAATFQALSLAETIPPDPKLTWPFYHETALDFYFLGIPRLGLAFENEALRIAESAGLALHASRSYDRRALILERLGNYGEAMTSNQQARSQGEKVVDEKVRNNILAHSALNLGALYQESGDLQRAVESYDEAIRLYTHLNLDTYQYRAHKGKLLSLIAMNDDATAETELGTVLYWFEENREKIAEESYRNKFFDTGQNTYEVAVDFEYSRKKDAARAFDYAEMYRARSLLDLMDAGAQLKEDTDYPEIKLSSKALPLTLDQIQQRLPRQTQLLEYSVLDDKILIWVLSSDGLKSAASKVSRNELAEKIRSYVAALSGRKATSEEQVLSQAKDLYAILIGPVEGYLNSNLQLCIVPDDSLNFLPFAALISPSSGRYLVENFTLETSPSATTFVSVTEQAKLRSEREPERLLIVGNPSFDREQFINSPNLPGAKREAEQIADIYAAAPLTGNEAVAGRIKQAITQAEVVHLATHAIPDERSPLLSKLLLARDLTTKSHHASPGFLQASEIYAMKLPHTRLVVLSACQTGIERSYRGEGAIGLARPFIAAGVPLVVGSLWSVESENTADFMISFHKHRKQDHVSTVEALRRAQLECLHKGSPNSRRDYGWAAFITIGGYANF